MDLSPFDRLRDAYLVDVERAAAMVKKDRNLLDVRNGIDETVLHWMVVENQLCAVRSLISSGAAVDPQNFVGSTPLMEAASLGLMEMCALLLKHGADVRHVSERGESPLSHAAGSGKLPVLELLLFHLAPDEPLQPYFDWIETAELFERDDDIAKLLRPRLQRPEDC